MMIDQYTSLWVDLNKWLNLTANDFYSIHSNGFVSNPEIIQVCEYFDNISFSLAPNENFKFYLEKRFPSVDFDKIQDYKAEEGMFAMSSPYGVMITIQPLDNDIVHLAYIKYPEVLGK